MNRLNNIYSPDGTLQSRTHSFRKLITTIKVNAKGDTIVSTANRTVNEGSFYYGNFEKTGGKLRLNTSAGYYDMETGENYQYLRNRQGSVMAVVNSRGETVQRTGLYPSGTPYILPCDYKAEGTNDMTPKTDHLHIGNHWMSQSGLNLYDNTARMHDPILCDMKSGDPKFFDYPSMNHFAFCGANPANIIDPLGENLYVFDLRGYLIEIIENYEDDTVFFRNEKGELIHGASIYFDGNPIKSVENVKDDNNEPKYTVITMNGDEQACTLFEKFSGFKKSEFTITLTGLTEELAEEAYITTSYEKKAEAGFWENYNKKVAVSKIVREVSHNHPSGSSVPGPTDLITSLDIMHFSGPHVIFQIYQGKGYTTFYPEYLSLYESIYEQCIENYDRNKEFGKNLSRFK